MKAKSRKPEKPYLGALWGISQRAKKEVKTQSPKRLEGTKTNDMEQKFIEIEGVKIESKILEYLLISGMIKAQLDADETFTPKTRKDFLLSCVEKGRELVNRLDDINNPKL